MNTTNELVVRKVGSFEELDFLSELIEKEGWKLGRNEVRCVFSADPSGFFIGTVDGKKISHISVVKHDHFAFVSYFLVEESYRGKGYGRQTWQSGLASVSEGCNVGLVAVENMVGLYDLNEHGLTISLWLALQTLQKPL